MFQSWFNLRETCPRCSFRFERAEGHWLGAVGMNTIVSLVLLSRAPAILVAGAVLLATAMGTVVLLAEVAVGIWWLGTTVYPRFDISREVR